MTELDASVNGGMTKDEAEIIADAVNCAVGMALLLAPKSYPYVERIRWVQREYASVLKAQLLLSKLREAATEPRS